MGDKTLNLQDHSSANIYMFIKEKTRILYIYVLYTIKGFTQKSEETFALYIHDQKGLFSREVISRHRKKVMQLYTRYLNSINFFFFLLALPYPVLTLDPGGRAQVSEGEEKHNFLRHLVRSWESLCAFIPPLGS